MAIYFKKPIKRAYGEERCKYNKMANEEYPVNKKKLKDNADIWWADETACQKFHKIKSKRICQIGT